MTDVDAQYDKILDQQFAPRAKSGGPVPNPYGDVDTHYDKMLDSRLPVTGLQRQLGLEEYDPNSDWDWFREAFDAAVFGQYSKKDPDDAKAKLNWEKTHPGKALGAQIVGATAPGVLLGTATGQAIFRAGNLAERLGAPVLNDMAKFLTGTAAGNALMRTASKATWGAGQGLVQSGYEHAMGQPTDVGANAILGAGGNVASHIAFVPQYSNIAPGVQQAMRDWSRMGLSPSTAQLPGASPVVRLWGKLFGSNPVRMEDVTERLMRTVGSRDVRLTPQTVAAARQQIKQGLGAPFNQMADSDVGNQLNAAIGLPNNPSARQAQLRQALNQWSNADVLDRIAMNSGPDGIATPKALLTAANAATRTGAPISPEINQLATGSQYFAGRGEQSLPHGLAGLGAAGIGAEVMDYGMPFLEHAVPGLPAIAHAGTIYGGANAMLGAPSALFQRSGIYRSLLQNGGVGPGVNPLVPYLMQQPGYQEKVQPLKGILGQMNPSNLLPTPAQGADAGIQTGADVSGLDPRYVRAIASIESDQNPFSNRYRPTQYKGLFQIGKDEWKQHGSGDIYNADDNARAFGSIVRSNVNWFRSRFGQDPTPTQIYMMHLQGPGFYENGTMTNVAGNPYPGMRGPQTPQSFEAGWGRELERRAAAFGGVQVTAGPTSSGLTSVLQPITGAGPSQDAIESAIASPATNALAGSQ